MYGPPEYPRASSSPTIILLVSGMTGVLGFLIGFFVGLGSGEAGTGPAPKATVTVSEEPILPSGDPTVPGDPMAPGDPTVPGEPAPSSGTGAPTVPPGSTSAPTGTSPDLLGNLAALRTLVVGVDIQPGTYRTAGPVTASEMCYWARMKGTTADLADVIAAGMPTGPANVTILPTDKSFQTAGCAEWTRA
jgi:hypothetical protein